MTATFADDTAILAVDENVNAATSKLQRSLDKVNIWTKQWRIKLNEAKSTHINFTNKKVDPLPITINSKTVPYKKTVKYLGMTLDVKLKWKEHVKIKKAELNHKYRQIYWLLDVTPSCQLTTS